MNPAKEEAFKESLILLARVYFMSICFLLGWVLILWWWYSDRDYDTTTEFCNNLVYGYLMSIVCFATIVKEPTIQYVVTVTTWVATMIWMVDTQQDMKWFLLLEIALCFMLWALWYQSLKHEKQIMVPSSNLSPIV